MERKWLLVPLVCFSVFSFAASPALSKAAIQERKEKVTAHLKRALPGYGDTIVADPRFTFEERLVRRFTRIPPPQPQPPRPPRPKNDFDYVVSGWARAHGSLFAARNAAVLAQVESQFDVPRGIIVGILGAETQFGEGTKGDYPIVAALYTYAVYRPDFQEPGWSENELIVFLGTSERFGFDPFEVKGSRTGARGKPQFEPSSYESSAMHYDGETCVDGKLSGTPPDLYKDEDAICSIGNYLHAAGWSSSDASRVRALYAYNHNRTYGAAIRDFADYLAGKPSVHHYLFVAERHGAPHPRARRQQKITKAALP